MKMKTGFCIAVTLLSIEIYAQGKNDKFSDLSSAEKSWVLWHPFKAKKALKVSQRTLQLTDSIGELGIIGKDRSGGQLDAFKHTLWMAKLSQDIGKKASLKLGKAHEKGNYKSYKKGRHEDGNLPDKISSDMDLFNNRVGVQMGQDHSKATDSELIEIIFKHIAEGELRIVKKQGAVYLTCSGSPIDNSELKGRWENEKCLVPSNEI